MSGLGLDEDAINILDEFDIELKEWYETIARYDGALPRPSALEFQHALNHLCRAFIKSQLSDRARHIEKAVGHIHRAHLDFLKMQLYRVQKHLEGVASEFFIESALKQGELRLTELHTLGDSNRADIFSDYRKLLDSLLGIVWSSDSIHDISADIPKIAPIRSNADDNGCLPGPDLFSESSDFFKSSELYWEWAGYEAIIAAYDGARVYEDIVSVITAFNTGTLFEVLPGIIATQKAFVVLKLRKNCNNVKPEHHFYPLKDAISKFDTALDKCAEFLSSIITCGCEIAELETALKHNNDADKYAQSMALISKKRAEYKELTVALGSHLKTFFPAFGPHLPLPKLDYTLT